MKNQKCSSKKINNSGLADTPAGFDALIQAMKKTHE